MTTGPRSRTPFTGLSRPEESKAEMKIAVLSYAFLNDMGGSQITLHGMMERLTARGHEIVLYIPSSVFAECSDFIMRLGYRVRPLILPLMYRGLKTAPALYFRFLNLYFDRLQKEENFDVWTGWMAYPMGVAVSQWAAGRNVPSVVRCAGSDIQILSEIGYGDRQDRRIDRLVREWLPRAGKMIALSASVGEEYRKIGISDEKTAYIPCGVDLERFEKRLDKIEIRKRYGLPEKKFIFITVGRNHPKKGFRVLVEACAHIKKRGFDDFGILFVGKDVSSLVNYGRELGVEAQLYFIEEMGREKEGVLAFPSDEIVALYRASDACAFPSLLETFALIVVEAWAAGLPVITTDAPGCGEIVRDGQDALVAHAGDSKDLAEKMILVLENQELRKRLSVEGRRKAEIYSWTNIGGEWEKLFEGLKERSKT